MSRHYVLDFDGTLFDTDVLWEWVVTRFVKEGFEETGVRSAGLQLFLEEYTVGRHAVVLGLSEEQANAVSDEFDQMTLITSPSLVYQDVFPFLESVPRKKKSILTFGHPGFQREKIQAAKIDQHVGEIRIASPEYRKVKHLEELLLKQLLPVVFIDDNPHELASVHEAGLPVELVRMRRPGARNSVVDHELDDQAWRVIRSLSELE